MDRPTAHRILPPLRWIVAGLLVGAAGGCLEFRDFKCTHDADCVVEGVPGRCMAIDRVCVYPDPACVTTQWSTADGRCVPGPPSGVDDDGTMPGDESSGTTGPAMPGTDTEASGGGTTGPGPTTGMVEPPATTSGEPAGCVGPTDEITDMGVGWASSTYNDNFGAPKAVDGNLTTSWFSSGPGAGGSPTFYTWTVLSPLCISQVVVTGNGLNSNESFRTNYGFEHMIVRVYDEMDDPVFQQMFAVTGTPDPTVVATPDVYGVRVELELYDHEDDSCGGFSELEIIGN